MTAEVRHYDHRYHAGNVGDVWKHVALTALFEHLEGPLIAVDTHAGAGEYPLQTTGEHTEGIGRLIASQGERTPPAVARYLELASRRRAVYPGSPLFLRALLHAHDHAYVFELEPPVRASLERALENDARFRLAGTDGLAGLHEVFAREKDRALVALIDPPYADRKEWLDVPKAIVRAHELRPEARMVLWYPVKSYARPNAMLALLEKSALPATAIELITSPLTSKKNRLNGSGLVFVNAPPALLEELAAIAAWLGPVLSAGAGFFTVRIVGLAR